MSLKIYQRSGLVYFGAEDVLLLNRDDLAGREGLHDRFCCQVSSIDVSTARIIPQIYEHDVIYLAQIYAFGEAARSISSVKFDYLFAK